MNESDNKAKGEIQATPLASNSKPTFIPLGPTEETKAGNTVSDTSSEFRERAKAFEPAANSLVRLPLAVTNKVLSARLKVLYPDDEDKVDEILALAEVSADSAKSAKEATARIFARRFKTGEAMDATVLAGFFVEIGTGFGTVMTEIRRLEEKRDKEKRFTKEDKK